MQRRVGDDRQAEPHARGRELRLGTAVQQVVHHLRGHGSGDQPAVVGDPQRLGHLPGRMVGQGDVAELALPDQVVVDRERLLQRRVRVGEVSVVEVDAVGAQPAQALLDLLDDVPARQAGVRVEAPLPRLGGQHHLVTAVRRGRGRGSPRRTRARDAGGEAGPVERRRRAVNVGGVEEVDAEVQRRAHDGVGVLGARGDAEGGRANADPGDADPGRAEDGVLHLGASLWQASDSCSGRDRRSTARPSVEL